MLWKGVSGCLWRMVWSILSSVVLWELKNRCGISGPNPRGRRWKQLCGILKGQTVSQVDTLLIWNSNDKKDAAQYSYTRAPCHCTRGRDSLSQLCHCAKVRNTARVCVHTEEPWRWFLWNSLEQFPPGAHSRCFSPLCMIMRVLPVNTGDYGVGERNRGSEWEI